MRAIRKLTSETQTLSLCHIPEPDVEASHQVKIAVRAGGICGTDLHIRDGGYGSDPPVTLGHEFSGDVVEVGEEVTRIQPGDRVTVLPTAMGRCGVCRYCRSGNYFFCMNRTSLGSRRDGGFADYCVVPEELAFPLPERVDYSTAALVEPLACCVKAVCSLTRISPGDLVLISGPGPIGLICSLLARLSGGQTVVCGTAGDKERLQIAEALGIDRTVDVSTEDVAETVRDLSEGAGADVVFECGGAAASVNQCLDAVAPRGRYTQVALIDYPIEVDFGKIIYKELRVQGSIAQDWWSWNRALELVTSGAVDLVPLITHQLPLESFKEAFDGTEQRQGLKYLLCP